MIPVFIKEIEVNGVKIPQLFTKIENLKNWSRNPRNISESDFNNLKDELENKGLNSPLKVMYDGTVLGGNQRMRALKENEISDIWITLVDFVQRENIWYGVVNGTMEKEGYATQLEGMVAYALNDNMRAGYYDTDNLTNLIAEVPELNLDAYTGIEFNEPLTVGGAIENESKNDEEKVIVCPACSKKFTSKTHKLIED